MGRSVIFGGCFEGDFGSISKIRGKIAEEEEEVVFFNVKGSVIIRSSTSNYYIYVKGSAIIRSSTSVPS